MDSQRGGLGSLATAHFATARLVEGFPYIFLRDLDTELRSVLTFLETVGVLNESLGTVLLLFPPVLLCDPDRDLQPRLRTLKKVLYNTSQFSRSPGLVERLHVNFLIVLLHTSLVLFLISSCVAGWCESEGPGKNDS